MGGISGKSRKDFVKRRTETNEKRGETNIRDCKDKAAVKEACEETEKRQLVKRRKEKRKRRDEWKGREACIEDEVRDKRGEEEVV